MYLKVNKSANLKGTISMPRSKTHSFRALILASVADGVSTIKYPKISNDWNCAVRAMQMYGAGIEEVNPTTYKVTGVNGNLKTPDNIIDINNSGTMLAYIAGLASSCPGWTILTGDESIRTLRTVSKNCIKPLTELGATIISTKGDSMAPFIIKGKVNGGNASMNGEGCQPVFSVLIASALSENPVDLTVENPGETAYIDAMLYWFKKVGIQVENVGGKYTHYYFPGNNPPKGFDAIIPYEWSAPWYPLLDAILCDNSEITVTGLDESDPYGDKFTLDVLKRMGTDISFKNGLLKAKTSTLHGIEVDMNTMPDQVPTIAVAACFARGKTIIKNAEAARWKECDRIKAIAKELTKMGAKIIEKKDGLIIDQDGSWKLHGTKLEGYKDHRMVLSLAVAGLASEEETTISDAEMVEKSFESFIPEMEKAGARLQLSNL